MSADQSTPTPREAAIGLSHGSLVLAALGQRGRFSILVGAIGLIMSGGIFMSLQPLVGGGQRTLVIATSLVMIVIGFALVTFYMRQIWVDQQALEQLRRRTLDAHNVETWHQIMTFAADLQAAPAEPALRAQDLNAMAALADRLNAYLGRKLRRLRIPYLIAGVMPIAASSFWFIDLGPTANLVIFGAKLVGIGVFLTALALLLRLVEAKADVVAIRRALYGGRFDLPPSAVSAMSDRLLEIAHVQQLPADAEATKFV